MKWLKRKLAIRRERKDAKTVAQLEAGLRKRISYEAVKPGSGNWFMDVLIDLAEDGKIRREEVDAILADCRKQDRELGGFDNLIG